MSGENRKKSKGRKQARKQVESTGERAVGVAGGVDHSTMFTGDIDGPVTHFSGPVTIAQEPATQKTPQPRQLPSDIADFTGRKREVNELRKALEQGNGRVVISAINGMGGVGKTTLAVHVAHQLAERYPDAQIVVDMQGTSQPLAPMEAMLRVIRAFHPETPAADNINQVAPVYHNLLAGKRVLILLDNAFDAAQVRPLVPPAPCGLIVTSRRTIILGQCAINLDALSEKDARALLREILNKRRATDQQIDRIAELCGRLPLALRVAGTFLAVHRDWTADEYIEALSDERWRLERLKQDDLDVEAVLGLSAKQLEQESTELASRWGRLAVFPATFDRAAAAAVWDVELAEARDSLSKLLERNLVLYDEEAARYRLHDLVRLIVEAQLDEATRAMAQLHHAAHYCGELRKANSLYKEGGAALKQGLALFDLEWRNIRAGQAWAATYAAEENQAAELCNRYPVAGAYLLNLRQHSRERIEWSESALIAARQLNQRWDEGAHLSILGLAYAALGEARHALECHKQHLTIVRGIGDRRSEGGALANLGLAYIDLGEADRAIGVCEQALVIMQEIGDRRGEATALRGLGIAYKDLGEARQAIKVYEQALVILQEIGDQHGEGATLTNLGITYNILGEIGRAIEVYEQALVILQELGDRRGEGITLGNLGTAYAMLGEVRRALEFFEQYLAIARETADRRGEGNMLLNMSLALDQLGEREQAICHAEVALKIFEQIESPYAERVRNQLAEWRRQQKE